MLSSVSVFLLKEMTINCLYTFFTFLLGNVVNLYFSSAVAAAAAAVVVVVAVAFLVVMV